MTNQFAATQRVRRKRALEAAGFVHVSGWIEREALSSVTASGPRR